MRWFALFISHFYSVDKSLALCFITEGVLHQHSTMKFDWRNEMNVKMSEVCGNNFQSGYWHSSQTNFILELELISALNFRVSNIITLSQRSSWVGCHFTYLTTAIILWRFYCLVLINRVTSIVWKMQYVIQFILCFGIVLSNPFPGKFCSLKIEHFCFCSQMLARIIRLWR